MMRAAAILLLAGALGAGGAGPAAPEDLAAPGSGGGTAGTGARFFESWEAALEGGVLVPAGDLAGVLDPAPHLGIRAATSYYRAWHAVATLSGAFLDGARSPVPVIWIAGATGLEWRPPRAWIPAPGAALALYYVRATQEGEPADEYLFLNDGESEFGLQGSLRWRTPLTRAAGLEAGVRWDMMFTRPSFSHAAAVTAGASWTP